MPFPLRDIRKKSSQHVRACAAGDGAICSKNRKIVPYHGANPNTRNGGRLRSPSPIMAPAETYYMASSASGQDDPNRAMWLATRTGKMEPSCPLGTTHCVPQEELPRKPYNKSFIDQVCSVKMAGYWPRSFFASLLTSTSSRSINTQKKKLANIPPSWPHAWSITHTYYMALAYGRYNARFDWLLSF